MYSYVILNDSPAPCSAQDMTCPPCTFTMQIYYKIVSSGNICLYHFYGDPYLNQWLSCTAARRNHHTSLRTQLSSGQRHATVIYGKGLYLAPDTTLNNSNLTAKII